MEIRMWEWGVLGAEDPVCGISRTPQGAITALSLALIDSEGRATGLVTPVVLADSVWDGSFYLPESPGRRAVFNDGVIVWEQAGTGFAGPAASQEEITS